MQISVMGKVFRGDDELREFAERRLCFALGRFGPRVRGVSIRIVDLNGPKGGDDKSCRVVVEVTRLADVVIEERGESIQSVLSRAVERAGRAVGRSIEKERRLIARSTLQAFADNGRVSEGV